MQPFDFNKYLKNNPLLKESIEETASITTIKDITATLASDSTKKITIPKGSKVKVLVKRMPKEPKVTQLDYDGQKVNVNAESFITQYLSEELNETMGNQFAEAALELVTLAKNLIRAAGESLVMNSEVKKASMVTNEDGLSELFYHLRDVLGELIGSEARTFAREAKKIIVDKYGITMTDEYGFPMKWR